jgi:hypothetical protein
MTDAQDDIAKHAFIWRDSFDQVSRHEFGIKAVRDLDLVWKLRDMVQDARIVARNYRRTP